MPGASSKNSVSPSGRQRRSLHVVAAMLGVVVAGVSLFVWTALTSGERLPPLSREQFDAAKANWRAAGIENYDIAVRVEGRQSAIYRVEVRKGEVASATRNGQPLRQPRTWGSWTVEGMFGTMEIDFTNIDRVAAGQIDQNTPRVSVYGRFNKQNGLPLRFRRVMWGLGREKNWAQKVGDANASPTASLPEAAWEIVVFQLVP